MNPVPPKSTIPPKIAAKLYTANRPPVATGTPHRAVSSAAQDGSSGGRSQPISAVVWLVFALAFLLLGWFGSSWYRDQQEKHVKEGDLTTVPEVVRDEPAPAVTVVQGPDKKPLPDISEATRQAFQTASELVKNQRIQLDMIQQRLIGIDQARKSLEATALRLSTTGTMVAETKLDFDWLARLEALQGAVDSLTNLVYSNRESMLEDRPVSLPPELMARMDALTDTMDSLQQVLPHVQALADQPVPDKTQDMAELSGRMDQMVVSLEHLRELMVQSADTPAPVPSVVEVPAEWTERLDTLEGAMNTLAAALVDARSGEAVPDAQSAEAVTEKLEALRQTMDGFKETLSGQGATLEELQSYVSELQPVAEAVESLSKSLAHSKPSQAPESGISAELQETMGQLTEVVSDVRRDVQAYRQEITRLSSQVTDLGRLPTNILQVSGVMERDPTTILYRTRVVLYPERKPSQPSAEKPQVFSEGSVVLTPSSFSAQPEPVVSVDDSVYSPARASLHGLGGGAVSPGNSTLP
ncbi:MAG: hypothetical protein H7A43_02315 [Verrucomicrobia bacterium]|nr:hypothetical protein [Verrucomicrobiota bacterium]